MPTQLERIREAIKREHPGMAKSRTYAIATSALKKRLNLGPGKATEEEMARAAHEKTAGPILRWTLEKTKSAIKKNKKEKPIMDKISSFEHGFFGELEKIGQGYTPQPSFGARHPGLTTAGGAVLGGALGSQAGRIGALAGMDPRHAAILQIAGGAAGTLGGGYLGYRHARKRQQQFLRGSPEGKTLRKAPIS